MGSLRPGRPVWAPGLRAGALLASGALVLSGCAGHPFAPVIHAGALRAAGVALVRFTSCGVALVRFTSCGEALRNLRAAAGNAAGPGGFAAGTGTAAGAGSGSTAGAASGGPAGAAPDAGVPAAAPAAANQAGAGQGTGQLSGGAPGSYSGTNTAEPGVDEPDLVKTDGQRIVTVTGGVLRVVDAGTQRLTGVLDLSAGAGLDGATPANLLLSGDHALVLFDQGYPVVGAPVPDTAQQVSPSDAGGRSRLAALPGLAGLWVQVRRGPALW